MLLLAQTKEPRAQRSPSPSTCMALTNETVQCQRLGENQNQDHTHKQLGLLSIGPAGRERCEQPDNPSGHRALG